MTFTSLHPFLEFFQRHSQWKFHPSFFFLSMHSHSVLSYCIESILVTVLQRKRTNRVSYFLFQGVFLTQGSNSGLLHFRQIPYLLSHKVNLARDRENEVYYKKLAQVAMKVQKSRDLHSISWRPKKASRINSSQADT